MNDLDIKKIRTDLGLTQVEFAKRLGISMRTVQNWESGGAIPESKHEILRALMPQQYYGGNVEQANVMGDNIKNAADVAMQSVLSKMIDLLAAKETSLQNAQAHIDRLLAIIDNLNNNDMDTIKIKVLRKTYTKMYTKTPDSDVKSGVLCSIITHNVFPK